MDTSELLELIETGEDSQIQFKEHFESIDSLAAEICAFSNSNGGNILVGISDDSKIIGLAKEEIRRLNQWVSSTCSQKIDPQVNVTTQNIKYQHRIIMVISVPMGLNKFYMANGKDIWVKVGADKRRAKREEIQRLLQSSGHLYADEMPVENTNLSDFNIDLFKSFYEHRMHGKLEDADIPLEKILSNLKLMEDGKLTLAGLLVFGKKPEEKKPQYMIKAVLFPGNSPAVSEYKDSRDISGNISKIFEAGRWFLINNLRWIQKEQHFNTTGILEIPVIALEEALINAIVHRNYFISSNIRIFIFDDRVEIISPGALPNTVNVESIKMGIHIERNPILVSMLKDIRDIPYRGIGTGVGRILRECDNAGITVDFIEEKDNEQFKVIFYRN
ncbi:MAG: transcriptional regulator [Candidatus Methanomarinus sp.]|uniref:Transcriptional regulator n=1 Tax=Candidatus Methanomarinus sp. TaxID=3386244 RepID=A0AC61SAT8_9EURY|nr:ATP-dependent DNA helicase RecG [ANME-2 cluster archaeon]PPA79018.1 MAG: Divergent AAA domain protein [ANME-2 cluster archaeon HR1]TKY91642.1 MAG: transcriptional regulator [ANME-2 cluster archaeon]